MCAAQSQTTLKSLQCHFIWNLDHSENNLLRLRHKMEDFSTEEGNRWLGHIYNLWGFIQYKLGLKKEAKSLFQEAKSLFLEAKSLFRKAAETLNQLREADEGPWLVVNYGNLAWLHHHLGDKESQAESQVYLSRVDALMREYPSLSRDPEIYAEKAWTLIFFTEDQNLVVDNFEKAASMQPDMVDWNTSYVIWLKKAQRFSEPRQVPDLLEKMREAKERDPKNLYLAVLYLEQRADEGGNIQEKVRELVEKALPLSNSGMWVLLNLYRSHISVDEAVDLAERVLREHPDVRYLKKFAAYCYRWRIIYYSRGLPDPEQSVMDRAIALHEELLPLYPHALFKRELDLATVYAKSHHRNHEAEQIFRRLLKNEPAEPAEPADKQMLYNMYANYLFFDQNDRHRSIQYHRNAAAIPVKSNHRENSIRFLQKTRDRGIMVKEIEEFLRNLPEPGQ